MILYKKIFLPLIFVAFKTHAMLKTVTKLSNHQNEVIILGCKKHSKNSPINNPERDFNFIKYLINEWSFQPYKTAILNPLPKASSLLSNFRLLLKKDCYNNNLFDLLDALHDYLTTQPISYNYITHIPYAYNAHALEDLYILFDLVNFHLRESPDTKNLGHSIALYLCALKIQLPTATSYKLLKSELTAVSTIFLSYLSRYQATCHRKTITKLYDRFLVTTENLMKRLTTDDYNLTCLKAVRLTIDTLIQKNSLITRLELTKEIEKITESISMLTGHLSGALRICNLIDLSSKNSAIKRIVMFADSDEAPTIAQQLHLSLRYTVTDIAFSNDAVNNNGAKFIIPEDNLDLITNQVMENTCATSNYCLMCTKDNATSCCSLCKKAWYCSKDCQKKHWLIHKDYCAKVKREEQALVLKALQAINKN